MEIEAKALLLESRNCFVMCKKNIWVIIAMAILGLVAGNILTLTEEENEYLAVSSINSYTMNNDAISSYSNLINSTKYCEQAAKMLQDDFITAETIKEMLWVSSTKDVPVISIYVHNQDRRVAIQVANALAKVAVNEANAKKGEGSMQVLEEAVNTTVYSDAATKSMMLRAGCVALFTAAAIALLGIAGIMSKKIMVTEDFSCGGQLPVLGVIPLYKSEDE